MTSLRLTYQFQWKMSPQWEKIVTGAKNKKARNSFGVLRVLAAIALYCSYCQQISRMDQNQQHVRPCLRTLWPPCLLQLHAHCSLLWCTVKRGKNIYEGLFSAADEYTFVFMALRPCMWGWVEIKSAFILPVLVFLWDTKYHQASPVKVWSFTVFTWILRFIIWVKSASRGVKRE